MTSASTFAKRTVDGVRIALGVGGVLAIVVGVLVLAWPGRTAMVVTAIIAAYAVVAGLVYAAIGGLSRVRGGWARAGHVLLGIIFVIAGVVAFTNLGQTTAWLAVFLGIVVAVMWITEGVVSLSTLSDVSSKAWTVLFAIISIVAGVTLLFAPLWGAAVLWMLMGISLIVLGAVNTIRAITFARR